MCCGLRAHWHHLANIIELVLPLAHLSDSLGPSEPTAVSMPKFTILSGHVEEVLLFNNFFSDCRYMP